MVRRRFLSLASAALLALVAAQSAVAGSPTEQLKAEIDRVINTLEDPALKAKERLAARRQAIRNITNGVFDWTEMAKRSLGPHWPSGTAEEREEFVGLFRDLLEHSYISKIESYRGERITYVGESVEGDHATVRTTILTKQGQAVPVDYRLTLKVGRWFVYDVVIDGISLVSNYRAQFSEIIRASSYKGLLERIKKKLNT